MSYHSEQVSTRSWIWKYDVVMLQVLGHANVLQASDKIAAQRTNDVRPDVGACLSTAWWSTHRYPARRLVGAGTGGQGERNGPANVLHGKKKHGDPHIVSCGDGTSSMEIEIMWRFIGGSWILLGGSSYLVSSQQPLFASHLGLGGQQLTMVINHLLTGMILQATNQWMRRTLQYIHHREIPDPFFSKKFLVVKT